MGNLNRNEQIKVAKMCARKGMPLSSLSQIGIDISTFSPEIQAELHGLFASNKIDQSIKRTLYNENER